MDIRVIIILALEALFALFLLRRGGVLNSKVNIAAALILVAAAFILRGVCLDYETLDYQWFLREWVDFYRRGGGFRVFNCPLGNYNIPYMYFLCAFSYSDINDLYLIKLLSIFFDVLLAFSAMRLAEKCGAGEKKRLACFAVVLFLPTVMLNGALWGQCDSIYVSLALLGIWLALDDRPVLSVLMLTLSFGFKLQAVFVLPIAVVLWSEKKYRLWHFALFPAFYLLLVLPAVLLGKPLVETLTLYFNQTGSIGSGLNYNSPSLFALLRSVSDEALASKLGIVAAFVYMTAILLVCLLRRGRLSDRAILLASLLLAVGIPFLLPHMHDRYFFACDVLSVVAAFSFPACVPAAILAQFASLLGYHAYLKLRYAVLFRRVVLTMDHGARALICVVIIALCAFASELKSGREK